MIIELPDLTDAECGDIAITAAEGGIGYWSQINTYRPKEWADKNVEDSFAFYHIAELLPSMASDPDYDWDHSFAITPALIRRGFELAIKQNMESITRLLSMAREDWTGEIDSNAADIIIQLGCFGEVKYA